MSFDLTETWQGYQVRNYESLISGLFSLLLKLSCYPNSKLNPKPNSNPSHICSLPSTLHVRDHFEGLVERPRGAFLVEITPVRA